MFGTYNRLNLDIAESNIAVIRALRKRLNPAILKGREFRARRHNIYRAILQEHQSARAAESG